MYQEGVYTFSGIGGLREGLARGLRGTSIAWLVIIRLIYGNSVTGEYVLGYDPKLLILGCFCGAFDPF